MHGPIPVDDKENLVLGVHKWNLKHEVKVVSVAIGNYDDGLRGSTAKFNGDRFSGHEFKVWWDATDDCRRRLQSVIVLLLELYCCRSIYR